MRRLKVCLNIIIWLYCNLKWEYNNIAQKLHEFGNYFIGFTGKYFEFFRKKE